MGFADISERTLLIDDGRVVALRAAAGSTVRVLGGTVWLTEDGRREDVVLRAGDRATLRAPGLALVEAIGRARVRVASPERGWRPVRAAVRLALRVAAAVRHWRARTQFGPPETADGF